MPLGVRTLPPLAPQTVQKVLQASAHGRRRKRKPGARVPSWGLRRW